MNKLATLAAIAQDLTASLSTADRYNRLLEALHHAIPYDAASLLRVNKDRLIPIAAKGLTPDAMGRIYLKKDHPRLDIICGSDETVLFSKNSTLPDPFEGMLATDPGGNHQIHACLGCPLNVDGKLAGILTADALDANAFDGLTLDYLNTVGAIAGAQIKMVDLLEALEEKAKRQGQIASELMQDVSMRRGWEILGESGVIRKLRREIELVGRSDFTILILGETGAGKELIARALHRHSSRSDRPMLYLNCAALPENLAESELFGHVKGAFTGATGDRSGKFELAHGGTLFLDEIGELPGDIQAKILRVIQEGEVQRVGSEKMVHVDVRLLAATNRDLEKEVAAGRFRADLYHRLNVYPLTSPPLRERKEDIPILAGHFMDRTARKLGLREVRLSSEALGLLMRYSWPGNVRELANIISRALLKASQHFADGELLQILPSHLAGDLGAAMYVHQAESTPSSPQVLQSVSFREAVKAFQKKLITRALEKTDGNWAAAARELDMNRSNLHNLATRLGLRQRKRGR